MILTPVVVQASAAQTASGVGAAVDLGTSDTLRVDLDVSAASGTTPTLVATVETSRDQVIWRAAGSFPQVTAVGTTRRVFVVDRWVRARWTIAGTAPSFTFALLGEHYRPYANLASLATGPMAASLAGISDEDKDRYLLAACDRAEDHLSDARYVLPIGAWGESLRDDVRKIAIWCLMTEVVGINPELGRDDVIRQNFDDAMTALRRGSYAGIVDSTPAVDEGGAFIYTSPDRGW